MNLKGFICNGYYMTIKSSLLLKSYTSEYSKRFMIHKKATISLNNYSNTKNPLDILTERFSHETDRKRILIEISLSTKITVDRSTIVKLIILNNIVETIDHTPVHKKKNQSQTNFESEYETTIVHCCRRFLSALFLSTFAQLYRQ